MGRIFVADLVDLSFVEHPTVVGLGDAFAGGLVIGLLERLNKESISICMKKHRIY